MHIIVTVEDAVLHRPHRSPYSSCIRVLLTVVNFTYATSQMDVDIFKVVSLHSTQVISS